MKKSKALKKIYPSNFQKSLDESDIAIIGAGIAGITTAYALAKKGHKVTLIDSRRYPAMATSYANGGQLSASNSETWNTTKNILNGIKWMFKKDAASF